MTLQDEYYTIEELQKRGVIVEGSDIWISRKASLYPNEEGISIGDHVRIDDFSVLVGNIEINNYIHIGSHCGVHASQGGKVIFEDYSGISSNVQIYATSDAFDGEFMTGRPGLPKTLFNPTVGEVILGKYSQVGCNSVVMPKGVLGEGTAIGALSLVDRELKAWTVYAGIPVREIRQRKKELLNLMGKYSDN